MLGAVDARARHHPVLQHPSVAVNVAQEKIEGEESLGQAAFDTLPFLGGDDAREQVGENDPLGCAILIIDGEGDALIQEALLAGLLAAVQIFQRQGGEPRIQRGIGRPCLALMGEHLVIEPAQLVTGIGRIHPRLRNPAWSGDNIEGAKILSIRESFILDPRSLTGLPACRKKRRVVARCRANWPLDGTGPDPRRRHARIRK